MIELMVTVIIMMLMLGGGISAYITFNERQTLSGDVKSLQTFLRSAQKKARVGDLPSGCEHLQSYLVSMDVGSSQANMVAQCTNDDYVVDTLYLNDSIELDSNFDVEFKVLHGGASFPTGDGTILLTTTNYQYQFVVSPGGSIDDSGIEKIVQ